MIVSFYDKDFKGLQNNASLVVDKDSYSLTKRPIETNSLSCNCEAFTEDIQPTFLVVKDDKGGYIYGSLAGIPLLNEKNITEITGTDLKTIFNSDIIITAGTYTYVNEYLDELFNAWKEQVNQDTVTVELVYTESAKNIPMGDFVPTTEKTTCDCLEEMQYYLKYYALYLDSKIDLINKKLIFTIGKMMFRNQNIKLWEYGVKNYGKFIASVNETQGYYNDEDAGTWTAGNKWILTSNGAITINESNRDIYPIKRRVVVSTESLQDANEQAITKLLENQYNEDIEITSSDLNVDFETNFAIYLKKYAEKYKDLPCGELQYDANGLKKIKIGFRYTGAEFIF